MRTRTLLVHRGFRRCRCISSSSALGGVTARSGMEVADAEAQNPRRGRLKRRCPSAGEVPSQRSGARPRTSPPRPEPFARPGPASSASANGGAERVAQADEGAIVIWQPAVEAVSDDNPAALSPQQLVRRLREVEHNDSSHRRLYKCLWARMHRQMCCIKASTVMSAAERAFVEAPGRLMAEERVTLWLALHGGPDGGGESGAIDSRPVGRPAGGRSQDVSAWVRDSVVLLTWNGDWGVFTGRVSAEGSPDAVAARISGHPDMQALVADFRSFVKLQCEKMPMPVHWAFAFEVSPSMLEEQTVRVHTHLVLLPAGVGRRRGQSRVIVIGSANEFVFRGCRPHQSDAVMTTVHTRANRGMSLFYVLVPKIGCVCSDSSIRLYHDVLVNPDWAFNLLQQEKITVATAREVIIRCAKNVPRLLANLDGYARARREIAETKQLAVARTSVQVSLRPFKRLPQVEEWLSLFHEQRDRYPFLVLVGPSRLGKTQFAEALVPLRRSLSVDCSSAIEPDLRHYASDEVDSIIFDEAKAAMVIRCKRLFQAPVGLVNLGLSATNCNAYQVMVHRKRLIVCSNTWSAEVMSLPAIDATWILANSVVVSVTTPLWEEEVNGVTLPVRSHGRTPCRAAREQQETPSCLE